LSLPHIVLIMTDQQRADFSRAEGFSLDTVPFLDALGARRAFQSCLYSRAPLCAGAM
jgi:hypothetical protein